jgi:hypothetical protein
MIGRGLEKNFRPVLPALSETGAAWWGHDKEPQRRAGGKAAGIVEQARRNPF